MEARVGDLAIAKFDPEKSDVEAGRKWHEIVCLVMTTKNIFYWNSEKQHYCIAYGDLLSPHRLIRVHPKNDSWDGILASLTLETVEPVK